LHRGMKALVSGWTAPETKMIAAFQQRQLLLKVQLF
jgi:hypothetical protein